MKSSHPATAMMLALTLVFAAGLRAEPPAKRPLDLDRAVEQLSADDFELRQKAYLWIQAWAGENLRHSPESLRRIWEASQEPEAKTRCYQLMKEMFMRRDYPGRGFLGITMMDFLMHRNAEPMTGVRVARVWPDTPASKAGLMVEDVIVKVDHVNLCELNPEIFTPTTEFSNYIKSKQPGDQVTLHLLRGDKKMKIKTSLMKRPPHADPEEEKAGMEAEQMFENWLKKADG